MPKSLSQTPAPAKDRIKGSKVNPKGSASSEKSASKIKLDAKTIVALSNKLKEFKEKHDNENITLNDLKAVYRRGAGAYSSSHRPTISGGKPNTRNAWAMARVNKFLLKAGGTKVKKAYVQDDDLMKMHLGGDMSKHLAPNGKPSKLTHEQWHLVRTPEFKAWFGDWENNPEEASKIVDNNGEPMLVYRTDSEQINKYKKNKQGIFFQSKKEVAEGYYNILNTFFIKMVKPKKINGLPNEENAEDIKGTDYDGVFNVGVYGGNEIIVLNPEQIKLADGTNTTFDGSNPDIRYELGGIFHGSPYLFNKFSTSKMGSGIGQQEDGWGIYLTDDKEASKNYGEYIYQNTLFKGKKFDEYNFLDLHKPVKKDLVNKIIDSLNKKYNGSLSKVKFIVELVEFDYSGYLFYKTLSRILGGDKKASLFLLDNGIDGLRRSFKRNDDNIEYRTDYVIFDENAITIESKEHLPHNYYSNGGELGQDIVCKNCGWEWNTLQSEDFDKYVCHNCGFDNTTYYDKDVLGYDGGGEVDEHKETYAKWKSLVNMSKGELEKFYNSQEGKDAGLSTSEANEQGISSGRESARWIMKMKDTPKEKWTPTMWKWANKQISFISRMSGNKGGLYDDKGNKTRKHTSLLIWGHNPEKMSGGGKTKGETTYKDVVELLTEYQFRERKTISDKRYKLWRNSTKVNGEEVDCFIDTEGKVMVLDSQYGQKEIGYDLKFMESYFKKNRLKRNKYNNGGQINQTKTINMDNVKFNQLPHIDTISEGDNIILHESVFAGNLDQPKHIGERYIHCKAMKMGGMVNTLDLEVIKSVGTNPFMVGQLITRPINNVLVKGRKLIVEPIAQTIGFKDGGINPDNSQVKNYFAHGSGNAGGVLVGKRHSEGGIKAINKSTGQPLEMEGGEVVITRGAVSNSKKYDFDGKEMTTREILSKLNVDGGGVSFAEGGDVPDKMNCGCKEFKLGGKTISPQDFVAMSEKEYQQTRLQEGIKKERNDHYETLSKLNAGTITIDNALREIAQKEMTIDKNYPFSE